MNNVMLIYLNLLTENVTNNIWLSLLLFCPFSLVHNNIESLRNLRIVVEFSKTESLWNFAEPSRRIWQNSVVVEHNLKITRLW